MKLTQNKFRLVTTLGWVFLIGIFSVVGTNQIGSVLSATSPWTQTDWSGGQTDDLAVGTVSTYKQVENLDMTDGSSKLAFRSIWFNESWKYRKKLLIDNTNANLGVVSEQLTDFPILVNLNSGNFDYSKAKADGSDIRFTDSDALTLLDYQIETWDTEGESFIWVKIPQIDINSNTDNFYIYYGNSDAVDAQNTAGVWSNSFEGVWLLNEAFDSTTVLDSASSPTSENGTSLAGITNASKIKSGIGGSYLFNALSTDYATLGTPSNLDLIPNTQEFTIDAWVKAPINATGTFFSKGMNTAANIQYEMYISGNTLNSRVGGVARNSSKIIGDNQWHHIVLRNFNSSGMKIFQYVDGTQAGTTIASGAGVTTFDVLIGARRNTANTNITSSLTAGVEMSSVRVSNVARTPAWIAATFKSESNSYLEYDVEESRYELNGFLLSNILDAEVLQDWGVLNFTYSGASSMEIKVRSGNQSDLSDSEQNWSNCTEVSSGENVKEGGCVVNKTRYIQYKVEFSSELAETPVLEYVSIGFTLADVVRPPVNATNVSIANFDSGDWLASKPTITWDPGEDNVGGSMILGYCISLDEADPDSSHSLDPESNAGLLQSLDDGVTAESCPYIVVGEEFDLSQVSGLNLTSGKQYYFSIRTVDNSDNINNVGDYQDLISFKYDNLPPTPPSYISMPTNFLSSKSVTVSWPSTGPGSSEDIHSGIAGLQYKIGPDGTWYGDLHTGLEDFNDVLVNDGSYTTSADYDYSQLLEGTNFFYMRAVDNLGNVTLDENVTTGLIKINTSAPSKVLNLSVNNSNNTENSYAFNWNQPASFTGQANGISYCYTINTIPDENSCTFTNPGVTELPLDSYATQPGVNTLYVVARDEASNINYATYTETGASITFTYSGSAPGMPTNTDISDISIKSTENWRLVISWNSPTNIGAGVSYYNVYRKVGESSCLSEFSSFNKIGSSNSTSYIDPDLQPVLYSYCVKACDSANNCSASSGTTSRVPTGKFTEPALLASEVEVLSVTTRKALISWVTDRISDSKIEYGLESGIYFEEEVSNSAQVISHNITLNNLTPGTTYFYRVKWTDVDGNIGISDEKSFATLPPPVVSNVSASTITTNSALINFRVRNATRVSLVYGTTESYGGSEEVATSTEESEYSVRLGNLVDGATYNYKFFLQDIDGNNNDSVVNFQFQTLPLPEINNLRFEEVKNSSQPTVKVFWETNVLTLGFVQYVNQDNTSEDRTQAESEYANEHELTLIGLSANTNYTLIVSARDSLGNVAQSGEFTFTTASDSRPPIVSNVKIETRLSEASVEFGADVSAQLILTWDTDELATSQVQFAQGTSGDYTQKTALDENLTFNHLVVINNLSPSSVYKLQVLSKDDVGNEAKGKNIVTITAQSKENPLEVIFGRLSEVFGFLR
jgi:hypothetical protein